MCQSCDESKYIFEDIYFIYGNDHKYYECNSCKNGNNQSNTLPFCSCNKGFYYDGSQCVAQKMGIIYEETFETVDPLKENWIKNSDDAATSAYIEIARKDGNKAVRFKSKVRGGDIFYSKYYQTMPFDEYVWISFDYNDKNSSTCFIQYGYNVFEQFYSKHSFFHSTNNNYMYEMPKTTNDKEWTHFEYQALIPSKLPMSLMFQDLGEPKPQKDTNSLCYIDNIQLISSHGLPGANFSHYSLTHPTIMILSIDYNGYEGKLNEQQFGFDSAEMTKILKTNDWDEKEYAIYIEELKQHAEIKLYKKINGQTFGDAYGRFVNPETFNDQRYFYIGDHIVFDNKFAQKTKDFELKDGNCLFEGPLKLERQNLENCVDDCQDYETVEEAMKKCLEINECKGVTFSHKLWGGDKSKGFVHGYGYQLRQTGITPTDRGYDRVFEHSWKKRLDLAKQYQLGKSLNCSDCSYFCSSCFKLGECLQCKNGGVGRSNLPPNCVCSEGFYDIPNQLNCGTCDNKCSECEKAGVCIKCKDPNKIAPDCEILNIVCLIQCNSCKEIDKCETCKSGVGRSGKIPNCECSDGYYHIEGQVDCQKCDNQCSKCEKLGQCIECKDQSKLPPNCEYMKVCDIQCSSCKELGKCETCKVAIGRRNIAPNCECKDKYYQVKGEADCKQCDNKCSKCVKAGECSECSDSTRLTPQCQLLINCEVQCNSCKELGKCLTCKSGVGRSSVAPECKCEDSYYSVVNRLDCEKCDIKCSKCNKAGGCTECQDSTRILPNCEKLKVCDAQCESCKEMGKCLTCKVGVGRSETAPECKCEDSFYAVVGQLDCIQCDGQCQKCTKSGECTECKDSSRLLPKCELLKSCDVYCDSCKDLGQCLTCKVGVGRSTQAPNCECQDMYYAVLNQLNCEKCDSKCSKCTKAGECTECQDSARILPNCEKLKVCDAQCESCKEMGKCLTCKVGVGRSKTAPECKCEDSFYAVVGQLDCIQCDGQCQKCTKSGECTECKDSSRLLPKCELLKSCDIYCDSCIDLGKCLTCKVGVGRSTQAPNCECQYQINLIVKKCDDKCSKCTKAGECTECKDSTRKLPNCELLKVCEAQCESCKEIGKCLTCKVGVGRSKTAPECKCEDSFYAVVGQLDCVQCDGQCQKCTKSGECTECKDSLRLLPKCELLKSCDVYCDSCKDLGKCLTCKVGDGRSTQAPNCECQDMYYAVPNQLNCEECDDKCSKCTKAGECTECKDSSRLPPSCELLKVCNVECESCKDNQSCIKCKSGTGRDMKAPNCGCENSYYAVSNQLNCKSCDSLCETCDKGGACTKCKDNTKLLPNCEQLKDCDVQCSTCKALGKCETCQNGDGRNMILPSCGCKDAYYEVPDQLNCGACNGKCSKCVKPDECTECKDKLRLPPDCLLLKDCNVVCKSCKIFDQCEVCQTGIGRSNKVPDCLCEDKYYDVPGKADCGRCDDKCEKCTNAGSCTQCKNPLLTHPDCQNLKNCDIKCGICKDISSNCLKCSHFTRVYAPKCVCMSGYYDDGKIECKLCKVECNQCDSENKCTLCKFGIGRSMNVKEGCKCASNYYEVQGELNCKKCSRQCEECSEFPNKCTKCADNRALAPDCKPVIQGDNYSIATSNPIITGSICQKKCQKCENRPDNCTICRGTNRVNVIPKCECLEGFHDENGTQINCLKCHVECKQCLNSKQCSLCDSKLFRVLNPYSGKCECASGYKENQQRQCQQCYFYKNICLFKCPDQTKTDENGKICQDTLVKIQQHAMIIIVCGVTIIIMIIIWGLPGKFFFKKKNENDQNQKQVNKVRENNISSSAHLTIL